MFVGKETLEFELMLISAFFRVIIEKWGGRGWGGSVRELVWLFFIFYCKIKKIRSDNGKMLIRSGILLIRLTLARSGLYCVCMFFINTVRNNLMERSTFQS